MLEMCCFSGVLLEEVAAKSVIATSQSRTKSSYLEEAENHLKNPTT